MAFFASSSAFLRSSFLFRVIVPINYRGASNIVKQGLTVLQQAHSYPSSRSFLQYACIVGLKASRSPVSRFFDDLHANQAYIEEAVWRWHCHRH